jgi:hypothetical protein
LTQTSPDEVVLNQVTPTKNKATIDFGMAKTKLLTNIYNWRISFPDEVIYLALANITACFCFPRIPANIAGAFGFIAEAFYFVSTSHIFGCNTSASSWEAFQRATQQLIPVLSQRDDLIKNHKDLLDALHWSKKIVLVLNLYKPFPAKSIAAY